VEVIDLFNDGSGLGFGIVGTKSIGVIIKTIVAGGVSARVGDIGFLCFFVVIFYCLTVVLAIGVDSTVVSLYEYVLFYVRITSGGYSGTERGRSEFWCPKILSETIMGPPVLQNSCWNALQQFLIPKQLKLAQYFYCVITKFPD